MKGHQRSDTLSINGEPMAGDGYERSLHSRLSVIGELDGHGILGIHRLAELFAGESPEEDEARQREDAYRKKVIESFFDGEQLKSIPVQRKKKLIVLEKIAERFTPGQVYEEAALSEAIARIHPDYCTIRRDMISEGILRRENGKYVRIK